MICRPMDADILIVPGGMLKSDDSNEKGSSPTEPVIISLMCEYMIHAIQSLVPNHNKLRKLLKNRFTATKVAINGRALYHQN